MVVTTGAGDRQAHHAAANDIYPIVNDVVNVVHEPASECKVTEGGQRALVRVVGHQIGGDLLLEKLVVRQVFVKRADDVIAVRVRIGIVPVFLKDIALGVRVTGDVQPVPSPAFAIT